MVAISFKNLNALADGEEAHRMEEESIMRIGRQKYKMEGHFPPVPSDPFLRLVFPRAATEHDKAIAFELYLPRGRVPGARYDLQRQAGNVGQASWPVSCPGSRANPPASDYTIDRRIS